MARPSTTVLHLDRCLVAWWLIHCAVGAAMWAAIGFGVCALAGWW